MEFIGGPPYETVKIDFGLDPVELDPAGRFLSVGDDVKYNHQFIIFFAGDDKVAEDNAETLVAKAAIEGNLEKTTCIRLPESDCESDTYTFPASTKEVAGANCRVYIVGHGTEASSTVGGLNAKALAETVNDISNYKIARVSIVACHAGGDGNAVAPHRFVTDFWQYAKGFVDEVTGYTGAVHTTLSTFKKSANLKDLPKDGIRYRSWSGVEWWIAKGSTGKKTVSREHDEGQNRRKIYISSKGTNSKGWSPVLGED